MQHGVRASVRRAARLAGLVGSVGRLTGTGRSTARFGTSPFRSVGRTRPLGCCEQQEVDVRPDLLHTGGAASRRPTRLRWRASWGSIRANGVTPLRSRAGGLHTCGPGVRGLSTKGRHRFRASSSPRSPRSSLQPCRQLVVGAVRAGGGGLVLQEEWARSALRAEHMAGQEGYCGNGKSPAAGAMADFWGFR